MEKNKINKENTEVTIVIPTFNRCDFVQKAIDSSLKQTYPCNIIVCDHGSKDDTPKVMQKYKNKIQYIRREEDFGPHFCWLDAVLHAKTEYVKILYDDDWMDPTFVEKTLALMKKDVSCVITNAQISYENKKECHESNAVFFNKTGIFKNTHLRNEILLGSLRVISPTCCLFRKEDLIDAIYQGRLLKKGGNYYRGVGPDIFIMLLGFLRYNKVGFVNEALATFRAHEGSITVDADNDLIKKKKIQDAYEDVIEFYSFLRCFKIFKVLYYLSPVRNLRLFLVSYKDSFRKIIEKFR